MLLIKKKKVGRPKGSSIQAAQQGDSLKEVLINEIATEWQEKVQSSNEMSMKKNELSTLINKKGGASTYPHRHKLLVNSPAHLKKQAYLSISCWH